MKTWDRFLPDVLPSAPGVSNPLAMRAVMRAAQEFCRNTRSWVVELDPVTTTAVAGPYDIALPSRAELVRIESATVNGRDYPVLRENKHRTSGRYLYTRDSVTFSFHGGAPSAGQSVVMTCALQPSEVATGIDDAVYRLYSEVIALGAVYRLTSLPAKKAEFDARCADVRLAIFEGQSDQPQRARPSFF